MNLPRNQSDKIDDDSVQNSYYSTGDTLIHFQTETHLLQNVKQIPKPSEQQKTLTFEQFEMPLTRHLEKRLTVMQEKFETYFEKLSKTVAHIECCQNQNTKTFQQNIANLKTDLLYKNEIVTTPINLMRQYKNHHVRTNIDTSKDHNKKIYKKIKSNKNPHKMFHK